MKQNLRIAGHSGPNEATQPPEPGAPMYECPAVEVHAGLPADGHPVRLAQGADRAGGGFDTESVVTGNASFGGCNASNGNASASTLNANNALSNSNSNYAGAFAARYLCDGKPSQTQPTGLKTTEEDVATGAHPCDEYDLPPFCLEEDRGMMDKIAESRIQRGLSGRDEQDPIWQELKAASKKRKIKNFKRFFCNRIIIRAGIYRCIRQAQLSRGIRWLIRHAKQVEDSIYKELTSGSYRCQPPVKKKLKKQHPDDKERYTEIYQVYDRCVQNIMLIVLTPKLVNLIPRTCYSGIKGRSLFSNNRTYCMVNQIRTACIRHPNGWAGMADILRFYDSTESEFVLGVLFKTVVCRYTRKLLADLLMSHPTLTIGGTMSQLLAMLVLADVDREVQRRFRPQFYASFGDNRIVIDDDRRKVADVVHFLISYVEGRYALSIKGDWQIVPVRHGFRFCKYDFRGSFVRIRSILRRRAFRSHRRGYKHFCGYLGILQKTDSKQLLQRIKMNNVNHMGMSFRRMMGTPVKIPALVGKIIKITDWIRVQNYKESEYYIKFQCITKDENGDCTLNVCSNGSHEVKEFFRLVEQGKATLDEPLRVMCEGRIYYFDGYHTSEAEALAILREQFNF